MAIKVYGTEWTEQLINKLSTYNLKVRSLCQKANFELKNISAMDETAVWNDMISNTTVEETGAQTVNREITHPNDNANNNGKMSSSIVVRSTPWGYPFKSLVLKSVFICFCNVAINIFPSNKSISSLSNTIPLLMNPVVQ